MIKSNFITQRILMPHNLILGCAPLAGLYEPVDLTDAKDTIRLAIRLGWGGLDTAPSYGLGNSEIIIEKALTEMKETGEHVQVNIFTKVGRVLINNENYVGEVDLKSSEMFQGSFDHSQKILFDYSAEGIYKSYAGSQIRLKKHKITGLRLHDAETMDRFNDVVRHKSIYAMNRLKQEGFIKIISLGMNDAKYILQILEYHDDVVFDDILMAGCWNLLDQSGYPVLLECQKKNIPVINAGIFGSGLLWGGSTYQYSKVSDENLEKVKLWEELASKYNLSLPVVALAFAYLPSIVKSVCIGARSPSELIKNHDLIFQCRKVPVELWHDAIDKKMLPMYLNQYIPRNNLLFAKFNKSCKL